MAKKFIAIRIPEELKQEFTELCEHYNLVQGKVIEVLIKEFIKLTKEIK